jgi:hypothetical protein
MVGVGPEFLESSSKKYLNIFAVGQTTFSANNSFALGYGTSDNFILMTQVAEGLKHGDIE